MLGRLGYSATAAIAVAFIIIMVHTFGEDY